MEVAAFAFSGLAVVISALGVLLNDRRARASGRIAQAALDESRKAATNSLWSDAIEAAHRVLIDPTTEPVGDKLATLRVRLTALVDGLPEWQGLDRWMAAEHVLGAALGREVMDKVRPGESIDDHMRLLRPYQDWGMAFTSNLRHLRNVGYSPEDIKTLASNAWGHIENVHARNGWEMPPQRLGAAEE